MASKSQQLSYSVRAAQTGRCRAALVHAYQGPMAVIGILPLGLVFTYYFARSRRLWPAVVAHMIFDTIGLLQVLQS